MQTKKTDKRKHGEQTEDYCEGLRAETTLGDVYSF